MNSGSTEIKKDWIKLGIFCGLLVSVIYPVLIFVPLPDFVQVTLAAFFGPLLGLASVGLYFFITLSKKSVSAGIAVFSNIIAGVLVTSMLLVQMAIRSSKSDLMNKLTEWIWGSLNHVHYGLDVTWDVYIFTGTFCFALAMYKHAYFPNLFSLSGIVISTVMIVLNLQSFPVPPANAGSFDMGPFIGLWYLAVTILILIKYKKVLID